MPRGKTRGAVRLAGLVGLALVLSWFFWRPAFWSLPATQWGDGQHAHELLEAARVSVVRFHELPLWNPYDCGGVPLWDNPGSFALSPFVWPALVVGTTRTIVVLYVLHSAIGLVGMWLLMRKDLHLSRAASMVASATWAYCGFHQHQYAGGHVAFTPFEYLPLALFLWRRAEIDVRYAVGVGILFAEMMYEGAVTALPHFVVILVAEALTRAWPKERLTAVSRAGSIAAVVAFGLGASRFLPVIDQLHHHKFVLELETDRLHFSTFRDMFLARSHPFRFSEQKYHWNEYGAYFGPVLLFIAMLGIFVSDASTGWLVMLLALSGSLMMGHLSSFAPWHLLKSYVFPFQAMRVPSRFVADASLFLAAFVGLALDRIPPLARQRFADAPWTRHVRAGLLVIAALGVGDVMSVGTSFIDENGFHEPPESHPDPSPRFYLGGEGLGKLIDLPEQNRGRVQCSDDWSTQAGAPLWEGDVPQAKAANEGATVVEVSRTQNKFALDIEATRTSLVRLNTNYDSGFRSNAGKLVSYKKELALEVSPGRHHIVVEYWPRWLTAGIVMTFVSMVLVVLFFVREQRQKAGT